MLSDFHRRKYQHIRSLGAENPDQELLSFYLPVQNANTEAVGSYRAIRARINQYLAEYDTVKRFPFTQAMKYYARLRKIFSDERCEL